MNFNENKWRVINFPLVILLITLVSGCETEDSQLKPEMNECPNFDNFAPLNFVFNSPFIHNDLPDTFSVRARGPVVSYGSELVDPNYDYYFFIQTHPDTLHRLKYRLPNNLPLNISSADTLTVYYRQSKVEPFNRSVFVVRRNIIMMIADLGNGGALIDMKALKNRYGFRFVRYEPIYCEEETECGLCQHHRLVLNTGINENYNIEPGQVMTRDIRLNTVFYNYSIYNLHNFTWKDPACDEFEKFSYFMLLN